MEQIHTRSGRHVVYFGAAPGGFDGWINRQGDESGWHFAPADVGAPIESAVTYPTAEAALAEAERFEEQGY